MPDPHYYKLKYINGTTKTVVTFPADINIDDLREKLTDFLLGVGWAQVTINTLFNDSEE